MIADSFMPDILYFTIIIFYSYLMSILSFSYDITGKSKYIMNSLPVSRRELVLYKYLSTFIYFVITVVYVGVYLWIIDAFNFVSVDYFNLTQIANAFPVLMILTGIVYPVYFRFEPKIAQIIQMLVMVFFFTTTANISFTGDKGVLIYLGKLQWGHIMVIALVIYVLSFVLAVKMYDNRDI